MAGMAIRLFLALNKDNGFPGLAHMESKVGTMLLRINMIPHILLPEQRKSSPIPLTLPQGHSIHWRKRTGGASRGGRRIVMGVLKKLIGLHRILFCAAALLTVAASAANLWWNSFLADVLDMLGAPGF